MVVAPKIYTYDTTGQLLTELWTNPDFDVAHSYDRAGNRLSCLDGGTLTEWTYDRANRLVNQAQGVNITTFTYDGSGNLVLQELSADQTVSTYDEENRLLSSVAPGLDTLHQYAGDGRRIHFQPTSVGADWVWFVWDGTKEERMK